MHGSTSVVGSRVSECGNITDHNVEIARRAGGREGDRQRRTLVSVTPTTPGAKLLALVKPSYPDKLLLPSAPTSRESNASATEESFTASFCENARLCRVSNDSSLHNVTQFPRFGAGPDSRQHGCRPPFSAPISALQIDIRYGAASY